MSSTVTSTGVEALSHVTVVVPDQDDFEIALVDPDPWLYPPETVEVFESHVGTLPPLLLSTADCRATVAEIESRGVTVTEEAEELPCGVSAMIADPYGNEFDVMQAFRA